MKSLKMKLLAIATAAVMLLGGIPNVTHAQSSENVTVPQGVADTITSKASFSGDVDPNTQMTIDIVMKVQNKWALQNYINSTVTPGSPFYRDYLNVHEFKSLYAPNSIVIGLITQYLNSYGIKTEVYPDNLIITATGTAEQIDQALNVELQSATYNGKSFRATKKQPKVPKFIADSILCILGLSTYSSNSSNICKVPDDLKLKNDTNNSDPGLAPSDLINYYDVSPLYKNGSNGAGQTIGIVTLAEFNSTDAYTFWDHEGIKCSPNRIRINNVDGGSGTDGADETALDVEQSGALAPGANINVYVGPNSDCGFLDAFGKAINDNKSQQISCSWGLSESILEYAVSTNQETPEYAEAFNELYMQAAAQGISMFTAAGDAGAYDSARSGYGYELAVENPCDSPYITAAGGTTLPWSGTFKSTGVKVSVDKERAWGWDYLYPHFDARGYYANGVLSPYFVGGGGGFSKIFPTPYYQTGVSGVNKYTAAKQWEGTDPLGPFLTNVTRIDSPVIINGTGTGRNLPDISMNADPYTGYNVYCDGAMQSIGGTSAVAPQLAGITALINSYNHTQVGFWNPQIYRFAKKSNSPIHPLNDTGITNDNLFFTGTKGTIYNQSTGLGTPDVAKLAESFGR